MGCDIHGTIEILHNGKWVTERDIHRTPAENRNYTRFAALAGVRGNGPDPRGIPPGIGETTRYLIDRIGVDGHSHSWLPLSEAGQLFLDTEWDGVERTEYMMEYPTSYYFETDDEPNKQRRFVFWFDN